MFDFSKAASFLASWQAQYQPKVGLVLGSGLHPIAQLLEQPTEIAYADIPGFPVCTTSGHPGKMFFGFLHQVPMALCAGRPHLYEGATQTDIKLFIRTFKLLGCSHVILTNAVGAINPAFCPGSVVVIKDHINLQTQNPLLGKNEENFGPRFFSLENAYNADLREKIHLCAKQLSTPLHTGVFAGVNGPQFETPAEILALKRLGADVVAMSLIPEVLVARHTNLQVLALSVVTNWAAGLSKTPLSHTLTLSGAEKALPFLQALLLTAMEHRIFT